MLRKILSIILLVCLCHLGVVAQTNGDFNPTLPSEPGLKSRIKLSVSPEGAGSVSGAGDYDVGVRRTISTSASGAQWKFLRWRDTSTGNVISTSSSFYYTTVYGTTNLVAEYEELPVTRLELLCNPKESNASLSGSGIYVEGRRVSVNAYVPTGYTFVNWTNKRTGQVVSTSRSFTYTKSSGADTLIANYNFSPSTPSEPTPAIVYRWVYAGVNMEIGGSVSNTSQRAVVGTKVTVSAYNKTNYEFVGWQRNGKIVSNSASYTVTVEKNDITLVAVFQFAPARPDEPEMSEKQPEEVEEPEEPEEPEPEIPTEPSTMVGDADGNWRVENTDLVLINGYIKGEKNDAFIFKNADINRDGRVNATDASLLRHYLIFKKWTDEIIKLWEEIFH